MNPGTTVELELNEPRNKWRARPGARATVVDGRRRFPDLWDQLREYLRGFGEADKDIGEFVWVVWDRGDSRWNGQRDGGVRAVPFPRGREGAGAQEQ